MNTTNTQQAEGKTGASSMSIIKRIKSLYIVLDDPDELLRSVQKEVKSTRNLPNKYLYLGWQGAQSWKRIDGSKHYGYGTQGNKLLVDHFGKIDEVVRSILTGDSNQNQTDESKVAYDIVSLGCGTGDDDVCILAAINEKYLSGDRVRSKFSVITIDISGHLVFQGATAVLAYLENVTWEKDVNVWPVHCDLENLYEKGMDHIAAKGSLRSNPHALYHFLGLTLSNNDELDIIRSIASVMDTNDFLLLGVDFSCNETKSLKNAVASYESGVSRKLIDAFMCGPLLFAGEYRSSIETGYDKVWFEHVRGAENVRIIYDRDMINARKHSKVDNAYVLLRHQQIQGGPTRLCDFSSKYYSDEFRRFIIDLQLNYNISLELVTNDNILEFGPDDKDRQKYKPLQHLVLLRLVDPLSGASAEEKKRRMTALAMDQAEWTLIKILDILPGSVNSDFLDLKALLNHKSEAAVARLVKSKVPLDKQRLTVRWLDSKSFEQEVEVFLKMLRQIMHEVVKQ